MKRSEKPGICEVKIHAGRKLRVAKPKTCEVKIYGKETRGSRQITDKNRSLPTGINQIVAQVGNRLSRGTRSFKDGGGTMLTLPEWQAIRKMPNVFKILLMQKIYESAPKLRKENFTLSLEGSRIIFIPGARDF